MSGFREPYGAPTERRTAPAPTLKITMQYRSKLAMIYELESRGHAFQIRITKLGEEQDEGPWRIEAHDGLDDGVATVSAEGATRGDALDAAASAWRAAGQAGRLPELDWAAIAVALGDVRAI